MAYGVGQSLSWSTHGKICIKFGKKSHAWTGKKAMQKGHGSPGMSAKLDVH